ncbi:MAG TPA: hypothetical protein VGQ25_10225 [Gemmatimonadales bacterium]|nr:hypothetical protein [Gemmatimonadales bacterium]
MSRALARAKLVVDGGAPRCPACGGPLAFRTDRLGRTMEQCDCGYRAYIVRRDGKLPGAPPATT